MKKKNIALLGSTGSIGTQTVQVLLENKNLFNVELLCTNENYNLLIEQAIALKPSMVVIVNKRHYSVVKSRLSKYGIKVFSGYETMLNLLDNNKIDIVLNAIIGFAGTKASEKILKLNKTLALSNKESLVVAGKILTKLKGTIIPVDSEHSAIFQCLLGEDILKVEKLVLTASGGPFLKSSVLDLENISVKKALAHPSWNMGKKITIDSATMMNKGFEMIEAKWIFDIEPKKIEILVHPQSIIHSMVEFIDGAIKANLSYPDMKIPILYSMSYPERLEYKHKKIDFSELKTLNFEKINPILSDNIQLCYKVAEIGETAPCILNASNEVTVDNFLKNNISFIEIGKINKKILDIIPIEKIESIEHLVEVDNETRLKAQEVINNTI